MESCAFRLLRTTILVAEMERQRTPRELLLAGLPLESLLNAETKLFTSFMTQDASSGSSSNALLENGAEGDGLVVLLVPRAVGQSQRAMSLLKPPQFCEQFVLGS